MVRPATNIVDSPTCKEQIVYLTIKFPSVLTKQGKYAQGHEIWIRVVSSWDGATSLCSYSRDLSISHKATHTHFSSVADKQKWGRGQFAGPAVFQQHLPPSHVIKSWSTITHCMCGLLNIIIVSLFSTFYKFCYVPTHTYKQIQVHIVSQPQSFISADDDNIKCVSKRLCVAETQETVQSVSELGPKQSQ